MNKTEKLCLGTAQWGLLYGISNIHGQTSESEVTQILNDSNDLGINMLDTANAYGNAEEVIGRQKSQVNNFQIITKTHPLKTKKITTEDILLISNSFHTSLERMKCNSVYALLVHNADSLLASNGDRLWDKLSQFKQEGKVEKIGVSVYSPDQLELIINRYAIDIVQLPFNIYDQRFLKSGLFNKLKKIGVEIHVRSVFLQGLLLMDSNKVPKHLNTVNDKQEQLIELFNSIGLSLLEGCLKYCLLQKEVDRVVIGCEDANQLHEIVDGAKRLCTLDQLDLKEFSVDDEFIINPSLWKQ